MVYRQHTSKQPCAVCFGSNGSICIQYRPIACCRIRPTTSEAQLRLALRFSCHKTLYTLIPFLNRFEHCDLRNEAPSIKLLLPEYSTKTAQLPSTFYLTYVLREDFNIFKRVTFCLIITIFISNHTFQLVMEERHQSKASFISSRPCEISTPRKISYIIVNIDQVLTMREVQPLLIDPLLNDIPI
ncbi:unnamed protein product [Albugo candida]|uniref:Uncharacterized protein n=1 Tax=Albugo candida TaxID=65357 RepID=A0A024FTX4_9STRA|nr:unnamed protein product [Albugo candida]|eukprot:CCI10114.1 unnamed protein product [Albugo candida]